MALQRHFAETNDNALGKMPSPMDFRVFRWPISGRIGDHGMK